MSGNYECNLSNERVDRLIEQMQKRLEHVARGRESGASAEELMIDVVGIRDYGWRLFGHYDSQITNDEPRKPNPFGFGPETAS
jgi:hypothetical protein